MTTRFASPESLSSFDEGHWPSLLFRPNPWNRFPPSASYSSVTLRRPLKSMAITFLALRSSFCLRCSMCAE